MPTGKDGALYVLERTNPEKKIRDSHRAETNAFFRIAPYDGRVEVCALKP
jgi:hypothetical protein